jgi:putative SOS response-associated peptidase YedK
MCGRYTLTETALEIQAHFHLEFPVREYRPRHNLAPGQMAPVILCEDGKRKTRWMRWGLVPSWAKDDKIGYQMINARAETAGEKPSFKRAFAHRRCIVPADSFYEWKKLGKAKIPMRISLKNQTLFGFAGLWESWRAPQGAVLETFTILTTSANEWIGKIHDRMPVILSEAQARLWLDPQQKDVQILKNLLSPLPEDALEAYEVSSVVNHAGNDGPECIAPAQAQMPVQDTLFQF